MATITTNRNRWQLFLGLVFTASVATQGCSPLGGPDSQGGSLDEMTAADATAGFKDFTAGLIADDGAGTGSIDAGVVDLSDDVVVEIEDLQFEFRSGRISDSQFGTSVQDVIGDDASTFAFAGFDMYGGPFRYAPTNYMTELLDLTEEQSQAADVIFYERHNAVEAARDSAKEAIRDLLTPAQLSAIGSRTRTTTAGAGFFFRRLPGGQALSDEQRAAITEIRRDLRAKVRGLHEEAREAFLELLTEEQLALLIRIENPGVDDLEMGDDQNPKIDHVENPEIGDENPAVE